MKIGDKVKVTKFLSEFCGMVGTIVDEFNSITGSHIFVVTLDDIDDVNCEDDNYPDIVAYAFCDKYLELV